MNIKTRWWVRKDLDRVLQIDIENYSNPWTKEDFLNTLRSKNFIAISAYEGDVDNVVGFAVYELYKKEVKLLNIAVDKKLHRSSIGRTIVEKIIGKLTEDRRTKISLVVRESNLAAQLFFKSMGFKAFKVEPRFYDDTGEDAYAMKYILEGTVDVEENLVEDIATELL